MRRIVTLSFGSLLVLLYSLTGLAQQAVAKPGPIASKQTAGPALPAGVQQSWWSQVQANIQQEEYGITWQDETVLPDVRGAWQAPNRAQGFRTYFTEDGIRVVPQAEGEPTWNWGLALVEPAQFGVESSELKEKPKPRATVMENRIEYDRGWITEWYVNSPKGLEQGFTIPRPLPADGRWQMGWQRTPNSEPRTLN